MEDFEATDSPPASDLVEVAFAGSLPEAEMIQSLLEGAGIPSLLRPTGVDGRMLGIGLLPPGSQRVMAHTGQADEARALLAETLVEGDQEAEAEIANATHLEEASGRKPRGYGLIGAYARIWLLSFGAMGLAFAVFLLVRTG
jgi:hypothetical protein